MDVLPDECKIALPSQYQAVTARSYIVRIEQLSGAQLSTMASLMDRGDARARLPPSPSPLGPQFPAIRVYVRF